MNYLSNQKPEDFAGKKVLLRLDLNVPLGDTGHVADSDTDRIKKSIPTIKWLQDAGAKVIIISHIGRDAHETLRPVVQKMEESMTIGFSPHLFSDETKDMIDGMANASVMVLENLRSDPREESNDESFSKELASLADIYVNDAFAVSHRAHASVVGIPKILPAYCGIQMQAEIENLAQSFQPAHPSILILGGAKFETKLPVIEKFLHIVDHVVIGGALANNFYKEMGYNVGKSLIDADANIKSLIGNPAIIIPNQVIVENERGREEKSASTVESSDKIVDIAPSAIGTHRDLFSSAQFILWNGPMGNYENGFTHGSESIAKMISTSSAHSIVGGGDSVALVEQLGLADKFSFISTGGGAMLEYLAQGTLPGIQALEHSPNEVAPVSQMETLFE